MNKFYLALGLFLTLAIYQCQAGDKGGMGAALAIMAAAMSGHHHKSFLSKYMPIPIPIPVPISSHHHKVAYMPVPVKHHTTTVLKQHYMHYPVYKFYNHHHGHEMHGHGHGHKW